MRFGFIAMLFLFCAGCEITQEHATAIATREVARRRLVLPANYRVTAEKSQTIFEPGYEDMWDVTFSTARGKKLYPVSVDRYNRQVADFIDEQSFR